MITKCILGRIISFLQAGNQWKRRQVDISGIGRQQQQGLVRHDEKHSALVLGDWTLGGLGDDGNKIVVTEIITSEVTP